MRDAQPCMQHPCAFGTHQLPSTKQSLVSSTLRSQTPQQRKSCGILTPAWMSLKAAEVKVRGPEPCPAELSSTQLLSTGCPGANLSVPLACSRGRGIACSDQQKTLYLRLLTEKGRMQLLLPTEGSGDDKRTHSFSPITSSWIIKAC